MCHFIKLVLPTQADVDALRALMQRHGRLLEPCSDPRLDRELASDERAFLTGGNCDCGTELIQQGLDRELQQRGLLLGEHRGHLPLGRAVDAGVGPPLLPAIQVRLGVLERLEPEAPQRQESPRREHDEGREYAKLRRSGWSETKIQRWRQQREGVVARKAQARTRTREREIEQWRALLEDLLGAKVEHVGLIVHWVTDEVRRGPTFPRTGLSAEALSTLQENILYTFAAR